MKIGNVHVAVEIRAAIPIHISIPINRLHKDRTQPIIVFRVSIDEVDRIYLSVAVSIQLQALPRL